MLAHASTLSYMSVTSSPRIGRTSFISKFFPRNEKGLTSQRSRDACETKTNERARLNVDGPMNVKLRTYICKCTETTTSQHGVIGTKNVVPELRMCFFTHLWRSAEDSPWPLNSQSLRRSDSVQITTLWERSWGAYIFELNKLRGRFPRKLKMLWSELKFLSVTSSKSNMEENDARNALKTVGGSPVSSMTECHTELLEQDKGT